MAESYFSEALRKYRKKCGFTQEQVARVLNIDRSSYTYYEIGKTEPTLSSLVKLSRLFEARLEDLLCPPEEQRNELYGKEMRDEDSLLYLSKKEKQLICYFRTMNTAEQDEVLKGLNK